SIPTIAQTAKSKFGFPNETGMALHGKELAAGVTYSHGGPVEVAGEVLNEKGDKETSLLQTSDDETARLQPLQDTSNSSLDGVASASGDNTVRLRDSATGAARRTLKRYNGAVYAMAFS